MKTNESHLHSCRGFDFEAKLQVYVCRLHLRDDPCSPCFRPYGWYCEIEQERERDLTCLPCWFWYIVHKFRKKKDCSALLALCSYVSAPFNKCILWFCKGSLRARVQVSLLFFLSHSVHECFIPVPCQHFSARGKPARSKRTPYSNNNKNNNYSRLCVLHLSKCAF